MGHPRSFCRHRLGGQQRLIITSRHGLVKCDTVSTQKKRKRESDNRYLAYSSEPGLTAIVIVDLFIFMFLHDLTTPDPPNIHKNKALQFFVRSSLTNGGHLLGSDGRNLWE